MALASALAHYAFGIRVGVGQLLILSAALAVSNALYRFCFLRLRELPPDEAALKRGIILRKMVKLSTAL